MARLQRALAIPPEQRTPEVAAYVERMMLEIAEAKWSFVEADAAAAAAADPTSTAGVQTAVVQTGAGEWVGCCGLGVTGGCALGRCRLLDWVERTSVSLHQPTCPFLAIGCFQCPQALALGRGARRPPTCRSTSIFRGVSGGRCLRLVPAAARSCVVYCNAALPAHSSAASYAASPCPSHSQPSPLPHYFRCCAAVGGALTLPVLPNNTIESVKAMIHGEIGALCGGGA